MDVNAQEFVPSKVLDSDNINNIELDKNVPISSMSPYGTSHRFVSGVSSNADAADVISADQVEPPLAPSSVTTSNAHEPNPLPSMNISSFAMPSQKNSKPHLFKTRVCRQWSREGFCNYGAQCQFAHGVSELRPRPILPRCPQVVLIPTSNVVTGANLAPFAWNTEAAASGVQPQSAVFENPGQPTVPGTATTTTVAEEVDCNNGGVGVLEGSLSKSDIENEVLRIGNGPLNLTSVLKTPKITSNDSMFLTSPCPMTINTILQNITSNNTSNQSNASNISNITNENIINEIFNETDFDIICNDEVQTQTTLSKVEKEIEWTETQINNLQIKQKKLIEIRNALLISAIMSTPTNANMNEKNENINNINNINSINSINNINNINNTADAHSQSQTMSDTENGSKSSKKQKKYILTKVAKPSNVANVANISHISNISNVSNLNLYKERKILSDKSNTMNIIENI